MEETTSRQESQSAEEPKKESAGETDAQQNKFWGALSYLGVLVVFPLLMKRESAFTQFHVKQGLVLLVGWILSWLPFGPIIGLVVLVFSIMGIINAIKGKMEKLPLVGELAEKINL